MGELFAGRYELVDLLGSGGVGSVWRVWDRKAGEYKAAKVLRQSDGESLLRFVQETSRRIDHPHVVAPHGWSGEDDRVMFTMGLVDGGSLSQLLSDHGRLPVGWAGELTAQALSALVAVHDAGLVHRDVKPGNLLLDATGTEAPHLWLSDFGASAQLDAPRLTRVGTVIGTPGYVAPEQAEGADPHPAQDVYALGVVTMQMLTGITPGVDSRLPPRPSGSSNALVGLWDLSLRMTSLVVAERPSAREALEVLDGVLGARDLRAGNDPDNPVEVFDQTPRLPEGWTLLGPGTSDEHPPAVAAETRPQPVTEAPTSVLTVSPPATRITRDAPEEAPRPGVPRLAWVLALLGLLLIVLAAVVW